MTLRLGLCVCLIFCFTLERLDRFDLADLSKDLSVYMEGVFGDAERDFE
jgi:hypothetical protein